MLTPEMGNTPDLSGVVWAADNGCYSSGARYTLTRHLAFLARWRSHAGSCLFTVAPDVPFDMAATWERSLPAIPHLRAAGYPVALAIQNGVRLADLRRERRHFDAVFIAGDKAFKTSATAWAVARWAKAEGMRVHIARRNSGRAVQIAYDMGADSVDGTFLKFAPDINWLRMQAWFARLCPHARVTTWGSDRRFGRCQACGRDVWALAS
jgi:hypothetical protein